MRRSGKEPSRVDLASYFSSALQPDVEIGVPEVAPQVRLLLRLSPAAVRGRGQTSKFMMALNCKVTLSMATRELQDAILDFLIVLCIMQPYITASCLSIAGAVKDIPSSALVQLHA